MGGGWQNNFVDAVLSKLTNVMYTQLLKNTRTGSPSDTDERIQTSHLNGEGIQLRRSDDV
jgi:hypothetical protein